MLETWTRWGQRTDARLSHSQTTPRTADTNFRPVSRLEVGAPEPVEVLVRALADERLAKARVMWTLPKEVLDENPFSVARTHRILLDLQVAAEKAAAPLLELDR